MQSNCFQRSQSRVWFGSQNSQHSAYENFYSLPTYYNGNARNPLQSINEQEESFTSPKNINESDDRKRSFLLWGNRHSPSSQSHKSQVSFK
jgi:hypothetical protein